MIDDTSGTGYFCTCCGIHGTPLREGIVRQRYETCLCANDFCGFCKKCLLHCSAPYLHAYDGYKARDLYEEPRKLESAQRFLTAQDQTFLARARVKW